METLISPQELKELEEMEGEIRGVAFKTELDFIRKEKGEEGVKKVEQAMKELGHPIKYDKINEMGFYALGSNLLQLLVIERLFDFTDNDFQTLGAFEPKTSIIVRLFLKYFASLQKVKEEAPKIWKKHYTVGEVKVTELNEEEKYGKIRLESFPGHPIYCSIFKGYFSSMLQLIVGREVECEETKCMQRGDEYHEFVLKW